MKTLIIAVSVLALAACGTARIKGDGTGQTIETKKMEKIQPAELGYSKLAADSLQTTTILSASITGNTLTLQVQYGGGCEDHFFRLEGSEIISKSLPPIRPIRLVHTGKKDLCKALIIKTLQFDLSTIAYQKEDGNQIRLTLEGYEEELMYTYTAAEKK